VEQITEMFHPPRDAATLTVDDMAFPILY